MSEYGIERAHHIEFPKKLSNLHLEELPDETGFTISEKIALRNAMSLVMSQYRKQAFNLYLDFFTEHDQLLNRFRNRKGYLKVNHIGHHVKLVLVVYDRLIKVGLDSSVSSYKTLSYIMKRHLETGIAPEEIKLLTEAVSKHIKKVVGTRCTPTLTVALKKVTELFQNYCKIEELKTKSAEESMVI